MVKSPTKASTASSSQSNTSSSVPHASASTSAQASSAQSAKAVAPRDFFGSAPLQRVVREPLPALAPAAPAAQPQTFEVVDLCSEDDAVLDALVAAVDVEAIECEVHENEQRASSASPSKGTKGTGSPSKGATTPTASHAGAPSSGSPPGDTATTTPGGSLRRSASYWQYKNREGPRALGTVDIPEVYRQFLTNT